MDGFVDMMVADCVPQRELYSFERGFRFNNWNLKTLNAENCRPARPAAIYAWAKRLDGECFILDSARWRIWPESQKRFCSTLFITHVS